MITIEFYRFIPTLSVIKCKDGMCRNKFVRHYDHEIHNTDSQLDYTQARKIAHQWLANHYGFILIVYEPEGSLKPQITRLCNCKVMKKKFHKFGVEVALTKEYA